MKINKIKRRRFMCGVRLDRLLTAAVLVAAVAATPMVARSQESEPGARGSAFLQLLASRQL
ncbi:MAG: hypothetical protein PVG41_01460 [Desulfobacteraceae bacterium]